MNLSPMTPEERFAGIVEELIGLPAVTYPTEGKGFGESTLKIHGKIFAMLVRGKLVVKIPKSRVDALVSSGEGERFDPRHDGRIMKEWVVIEPSSAVDWLDLSREAMEFVSAKQGGK
jgi:hypothetical protein